MTTAQAIAEMMAAWNKVEALAREQHPTATDEQIYSLTKSVMDKSLNLA